jgi:hypothetical protein
MIESPQGENIGDPGGNEMKSEVMKEGPHIGQGRRCGKAWESVVANGFQEIRTTVKSVVPARDTRTSRAYMYNVRWTSKLSLLSLIAATDNNIYQQRNNY